jgi:hypothetical protein
MDLSLIALLSFNHFIFNEEIKRKTMYSILSDFGVFEE